MQSALKKALARAFFLSIKIYAGVIIYFPNFFYVNAKMLMIFDIPIIRSYTSVGIVQATDAYRCPGVNR